MISNVRSQASNNYSNNISFKAIPLGRYQPAKNTIIDVLQLEKSDLPFITRFCENIGDYFRKHNITDFATQDIMKDSFSTAKDILSSDDKLLDDAKVLVGVSKGNLHGILIGNIPKRNANGNVHYSSRKNHSKGERELDWFVSWNSKGVGKSLMCEFFKKMKVYPFKKLFVRSEVPENSPAKYIYEHFGFKQIEERTDWVKKTNNINIVDEAESLEHCDIIPMAINHSQLEDAEKNLSKQCNRIDLNKISVPIESVVK